MAPRNEDGNPTYSKKKSCPIKCDEELAMKSMLPCLLHKKHKVVKLVKSQLQKIHEEGLLCGMDSLDNDIILSDDKKDDSEEIILAEPGPSKVNQRLTRRAAEGEDVDMNRRESGCLCLFFYILAFIFAVLLFIFITVWISAGPLSNSMAHTPIPSGSFVRTDKCSSLEKKYLLRWSKPDHE